MNRQEQRIAIAEACGYKRLTQHEAVWSHKGSKIYTVSNLPDYLSSLDAMNQAEKTLTLSQRNRYNDELRFLCANIDIWHASAEQRAEAFLKTIGKWKEE